MMDSRAKRLKELHDQMITDANDEILDFESSDDMLEVYQEIEDLISTLSVVDIEEY